MDLFLEAASHIVGGTCSYGLHGEGYWALEALVNQDKEWVSEVVAT